MSLVTGLLTHYCSILRPQFDVNENITGYQIVATNVDVLISQKNTVLSTGEGGREVVTSLIAIMEWVDQTHVNVNDVLTAVTNWTTGQVLQDSQNGQALVNMSYKVTGSNDPNYAGDHLELPIEQHHGRVEGQP